MKRVNHFFACLATVAIVGNHALIAQTSSARDPGCLACHACEVPTKVNPCLKKCPRDEMVTVHHSAEAAPEKIVLNKLEGSAALYEPVSFAHRAHAEMSEMSGNCVLCHHYNRPGAVLGCSECHATEIASKSADLSKPSLKGAYHRECMKCHQECGLSTDCESCHAPKAGTSAAAPERRTPGATVHPTKPGRLVIETANDDGKLVTFFHDDHAGRFGLACSSCHTDERCAQCHKAAASATPIVHITGGHDRCAPCHSVDDNCGFCHSNQPRARFNHFRKAGFDLTRFHSTLACTRCHGHTSNYKGLSRTCSACHTKWASGSFDHSVTGLKLDETHAAMDCENCHLEKDFAKKPTCSGCHDDKSYPKEIPGTRVRSAPLKSL
jgi:hypothetical protein